MDTLVTLYRYDHGYNHEPTVLGDVIEPIGFEEELIAHGFAHVAYGAGRSRVYMRSDSASVYEVH